VNRQAQAVILLLVGGAVLRASLTDLYLRYVKQGLRPFLIAAGIILVLTATATLWYELSERNHRDEHDDEHDDEHGHAHGGPKVAWLLLLPVLGLLLVAPPALGSYAANRAGTAITASDDYAPLPAGDPVHLTMLDYAARAVFDQGHSMTNRRIELSGFLTTAPDGTWLLTRMILTCCAADARPIKVALTGEVPPGLTADGWLQVIGRYSPQTVKDPVNGERIPFLTVETADSVPAPAEQYES
jgi:uncharacterized repeat protein (TIGR03943 family)